MYLERKILIAFVAFLLGAAALFLGCGGLPEDAAVSVNGIIITKADVDARIDYRNKLSPGMVSREDEVNFPKIRRQTTRDLVLSELERQEGERRGISVSAEEVDAALLEMAENDYLGDVTRMMELFAEMGITEQELKDATSERLLHEKLTADVRKDVAVSDLDIQNYYEKNRKQYQQSEMRQARMIEVGSEAAAREAAGRIKSGESFVDVAKQASVDPLAAKNGGNLGLVERGQLSPELDNVLFGMSVGQISDPVKVADKWYVLTVEAIQPGRPPKSLDEARDEIREIIAIELAASQWKSLMDGYYNDAALEFDPQYDPALT